MSRKRNRLTALSHGHDRAMARQHARRNPAGGYATDLGEKIDGGAITGRFSEYCPCSFGRCDLAEDQLQPI